MTTVSIRASQGTPYRYPRSMHPRHHTKQSRLWKILGPRPPTNVGTVNADACAAVTLESAWSPLGCPSWISTPRITEGSWEMTLPESLPESLPLTLQL